ncbi:putative celp0028 effector like protein [Erysiphe neolycopersici]|uniref:Putative celp0028 effector like protein n=1 Tax=Erysiphe neolycopersici TaxID=212602 RepID=A0A420HVH1_9PEZI|nr:putative celp0028 effector like protein [Erysiphe neolycopersici]
MYLTPTLVMRATIVVFGVTTIAKIVAASDEPSSQLGHLLNADEVILYNSEGRIEIVPRSESLHYLGDLPVAKAEQRYANFTVAVEEDKNTGNKIQKRCKRQKVFTMKPVETYVNWDVAMSGVIRAPPHARATILVGSGYRISNSLSVNSPISLDVVQKYLTHSLGISYSKSWTTLYSSGYSFGVPPGKYGAIVSNPIATRHSGYMDIGCLGDSKRVEFSGESYQSKGYSGLTWVDGIIGLCVGDTYPLPRCFGNGTL